MFYVRVAVVSICVLQLYRRCCKHLGFIRVSTRHITPLLPLCEPSKHLMQLSLLGSQMAPKSGPDILPIWQGIPCASLGLVVWFALLEYLQLRTQARYWQTLAEADCLSYAEKARGLLLQGVEARRRIHYEYLLACPTHTSRSLLLW